jgi:hypothetical protein
MMIPGTPPDVGLDVMLGEELADPVNPTRPDVSNGQRSISWLDTLLGMVPRWLKGRYSLDPAQCGDGYKILTAMGALQDEHELILRQGMAASFPGFSDDRALDLLGLQRGIVRGPLETSSAYAERLRFWRQTNMRKGSPWVLLEQVQAYLAGYPVEARIICGNGSRGHGGTGDPATRYTLAPGGYLYHGDYLSAPNGTAVIDGTPTEWDWGRKDPLSPFDEISREWLLLYGHPWQRDGIWSDPGLWNDLDSSDNGPLGTPLDPYQALAKHPDRTPTYGSTAAFATVSGLLGVCASWVPPHAKLEQVIVCFDRTTFDTFQPDGTYNLPGNRNPNVLYWKG